MQTRFPVQRSTQHSTWRNLDSRLWLMFPWGHTDKTMWIFANHAEQQENIVLLTESEKLHGRVMKFECQKEFSYLQICFIKCLKIRNWSKNYSVSWLPACQTGLSTYLSIYLFSIYLSVCLFVCPTTYLPACLSVYVPCPPPSYSSTHLVVTQFLCY